MAYNSGLIKEAKEQYLLEMNDEALKRLFKLLRTEKVIVICRSEMSEEQAAKAGLKELEPDILRDAGGDFWFPVYSAESEIPPEATNKFHLIRMDFSRSSSFFSAISFPKFPAMYRTIFLIRASAVSVRYTLYFTGYPPSAFSGDHRKFPAPALFCRI